MPVPTDTQYPAVATNAAWQKKKSVLDKGIKTKVGPALVLAEQKWKDIKFNDLKTDKINKQPGAAQAALQKAQAAWADVVEARKAVKAAHAVATTQSTNNKLNSASRTALKAIVVALKKAEARLDNMDDILPALTVDVNNALAAARANLKNLEIKAGSKVVANAKTAKQGSNSVYEVKGVEWRIPPKLTLDLLKKNVKVSAHDASGHLVKLDMTVESITGTTEMKLK